MFEVEDPSEWHAPSLLPNYLTANLDARKEMVTLEHLLAMSDGMDWPEHDFPYDDERNMVRQMRASADAVQFVLDRPMAREPGEAWAYNSGTSVLLGAILERATGHNLLVFARETLFDPIGIGTVYWEQMNGGHYHTGAGLSMTPQDAARLGYLMLRNGTWDGEQIVPADWVTRSTRAYHPAYGCYGYGFQWWILPGGQGYQASGLYDQRISVLPEADMVVVTTAHIPDGSLYGVDALGSTFLLPACTDLPQDSRRETYNKYGLSLEYPRGFCLVDTPIPGQETISDASGIAQITSSWEPSEILSLLWREAELGADEQSSLEAYLAALAETGIEITLGERREGQKDSHAMALQFSSLTMEGSTLPAVSAAWICEESGRVFAVTYTTAAEVTSQELPADLERYLAGLTCH